jgi:hypothetical protein
MKMQIHVLLAVIVMAGMTGCATVTEAGYYWGNYSKTLYAYSKAPSDETLTAHKTELERIIEESNKRNLKVPPGIHAELGYLEALRGQDALAKAHYENEIQLYPESRVFLERLMSSTPSTKR